MKRVGLAGLLLCVLLLVSKLFAYPTINSFLTVEALPSGGTLNDVYSGVVITNIGATGAQTVNLPRAIKGLQIIYSLAVAQDVDIDPQTGDKILGLTDMPGDKISSDAVIRTTVELVALDDTNWLPIRTQGTWTDAN